MNLECDISGATFRSKFFVLAIFSGSKTSPGPGAQQQKFSIAEQIEVKVNNITAGVSQPEKQSFTTSQESEVGFMCMKKKVTNDLTVLLDHANLNGNENSIKVQVTLKPREYSKLVKLRIATCYCISNKLDKLSFRPVYWKVMKYVDFYKDTKRQLEKFDRTLEKLQDGLIKFTVDVPVPDTHEYVTSEGDILAAGYCVVAIPYFGKDFKEKELTFAPFTIGSTSAQQNKLLEPPLVHEKAKHGMMFSSYVPANGKKL